MWIKNFSCRDRHFKIAGLLYSVWLWYYCSKYLIVERTTFKNKYVEVFPLLRDFIGKRSVYI